MNGRRGRPPLGNRQGERSAHVGILLKPRLKELLAAAGTDQFRSISGQASKYVIDGLLRDGYIVPSKKEEL